MGADKLAENTPNAPKFICPNCLPKPKMKKRLHCASVVRGSKLISTLSCSWRGNKSILDYYTYQRDFYPRNYVLIPLRWLKIGSVLNFSRKRFFNCPKFVLFYKLENYRIRVYICRKVLSCGMHRNACTNTILLKAAKYVMKFLSKYIFLRKLGTTLAAAESIR